MTSPETDYTEDSLVEQPTIDLFEQLGWETVKLKLDRKFLSQGYFFQSNYGGFWEDKQVFWRVFRVR